MKHLLEAINRGILRGLNENNIELLTDLDDDNLDLMDSILTKSVNNKIDYSIKYLLIHAIQTGKSRRELKLLINDPTNFHKYKSIIKANDEYHLKKLIKIGLKLFGNKGNFNWIDTSGITDMSRLFYNSYFNGHIELWDVSNVETMYKMFCDASNFNQPIGDWDVSNVKDMSSMFDNAVKFNLSIGDWDVSNVRYMTRMFCCATAFNLPINCWDVSSVKVMCGMFWGARKFNQPIGDWDVSNVTYMGSMFELAAKFNLPIGDWDTSNVTDMSRMFQLSAFNQDISKWNVKKVKNMTNIYYGCPKEFKS